MRARTAFLLALLALPLQADDRQALRELRRDSAVAYNAKDWPRFLALTKQAAALRPGDPRWIHNLACAEALNGNAAASAAAAARLAALDVDTGVLEDEDLAKVKDDPAFAAVRERMTALAAPVGKADVAFRLEERALLTEGIAFDPKTKRFFLSSVHERKVVVRDAAGKESDLFPSGRDGVLGILALRADPASRSLWATSAEMPEMEGYSAERDGRSELLRFDLDSGKLLGRWAPGTEGKHNLNDLALDAKGTVFVSDALGGGVWTLAADAKALRPLVPAGVLASPQGLAFSRDGKTLFVADYDEGLFAVDMRTRALVRVEGPRDLPLTGIDGLVADGDDLLAVQNGVRPHRVVRLVLEKGARRIARAETLLRNDPRFDEPTLAVIVSRDLYLVAASQWPKFAPKVFSPAKLKEPLVLRVSLGAR